MILDQTFLQTLKVEWPAPRLLLLTLNRPQAANAVNTEMASELLALFEKVAQQPSEIRCIVLTGAGDRAFCAGADLKERHEQSVEDWTARHRLAERRVRLMADCPVPIIAAVNGAAFAGGCELALSCDFIYASIGARFALTEVTLGIMPGAGGTQNLTRAVGVRRAKEIILSGRPFSAQEAFDWGMVNRLCAPEDLMPAALDMAKTICANAPMAVRQAKHAIQQGASLDLQAAMMFEIECYYRLVPTADRVEGSKAYAEKRRPVFNDR
jgi:enoyl-CoA hydratase